mmetsp:Transcript_19559/g.59193  ORF Transcript_19559/g.59193 Transcript_19559/m.59193 type:complete len:609 (+) Transcript_19559:178-2004(+)
MRVGPVALHALMAAAWCAAVDEWDAYCDTSSYYGDEAIAAIVAGTSTLSLAEKHQVLHDLVKANFTSIPYTSNATDVWDALRDIDEDPENANNVLLLYSRRSEPKGAQATPAGWNREHIWPKSFGVGHDGVDMSDIVNLMPADETVNAERGNRYFAGCLADDSSTERPGSAEAPETASCYDGDAWEPPPSMKGDVARVLFYMSIRYNGMGEENVEDLQLSDCPCKYANTMGRLSDLLLWHDADPVDDAEVTRNTAVCSRYQHNRNPFVDHPSLVSQLFDAPESCTSCRLCEGDPYSDGQCQGSEPPPATPIGAPTSPPSEVGQCSGLKAGDVLVVGVQSDAPDDISLVPMVDLSEGTQFMVTDNGFDGSDDHFRVNEGTITFTVPSGGVSAGQVIHYQQGSTGSGWSSAGQFDPSTSGDSLLVYSGDGCFIYGLTYASEGWIADPSQVSTSKESGLPPSLAEMNVALPQEKHMVFHGSREGTVTEIQGAISDPSQWSSNSDSRLDFNSYFNDPFTVEAAQSAAPSADPSGTPVSRNHASMQCNKGSLPGSDTPALFACSPFRADGATMQMPFGALCCSPLWASPSSQWASGTRCGGACGMLARLCGTT